MGSGAGRRTLLPALAGRPRSAPENDTVPGAVPLALARGHPPRAGLGALGAARSRLARAALRLLRAPAPALRGPGRGAARRGAPLRRPGDRPGAGAPLSRARLEHAPAHRDGAV